MLASAGWTKGMRLGLKKRTLMLVILSSCHLCPQKLSRSRRIFQFICFILASSSSSALANTSCHPCLLVVKIPKSQIPPLLLPEHHSFSAVAMNNKQIILVPMEFIITNTDIFVLSNFSPGNPFVNKPLFWMDFQKKLVSSALNTSFKPHPQSLHHILSHSSLTQVRLTKPASP